MNLLRHFVTRLIIFVTILFSGQVLVHQALSHKFLGAWIGSVFSIAQAREDEDEEDEDEPEDEEDDDFPSQSTPSKTSSSKTQTKTTEQEVIEYRPVTRTVIVTDPLYETDSDGDGLVDGLDPEPLVDQRLYFTDADQDGMPNIWDRYPGEDDFAYVDDETDANQNGLVDLYE